MKTQFEHVQRWEDIIFEKRNKSYGAYAIRKNNNGDVLKAEAISIGIAVLIFIIPILLPDDQITKSIIATPDDGFVLQKYENIKPNDPPTSKPPKRVNADVIPLRATSEEVVEKPPADPVESTTYNGTEGTGTLDAGAVQSAGTDLGIPIEIPKPPDYTMAPEVMPSYEGGMEAMMKFLQKKMRYPRIAEQNREEGTVYVSFIISSTGQVTNIEVIKGVSKPCDKEAVRVISMMDKWKPGLQNKMPVAVKMVLPIKFQLGN